MAHKHFTREDRVFLAKLLKKDTSILECARILDFHPSTIYRELKRGESNTTIKYSTKVASKSAD